MDREKRHFDRREERNYNLAHTLNLSPMVKCGH